jgi:hypothetical protein
MIFLGMILILLCKDECLIRKQQGGFEMEDYFVDEFLENDSVVVDDDEFWDDLSWFYNELLSSSYLGIDEDGYFDLDEDGYFSAE